MATVNNDISIMSYGKLIANFGAAYAATHKSVKSHSSTIVLMQGQLQAMQQFCMALQQQQPHPTTYALQQQQRGCHDLLHHNNPGGVGRGYPALAYQQLRWRNAICSPSCPSRGSTAGITAAPMAGTSTTPTPAVRAVTQVSCTIYQRQGQTRWEAQQWASTR
jgi:hypothetical protein